MLPTTHAKERCRERRKAERKRKGRKQPKWSASKEHKEGHQKRGRRGRRLIAAEAAGHNCKLFESKARKICVAQFAHFPKITHANIGPHHIFVAVPQTPIQPNTTATKGVFRNTKNNASRNLSLSNCTASSPDANRAQTDANKKMTSNCCLCPKAVLGLMMHKTPGFQQNWLFYCVLTLQ